MEGLAEVLEEHLAKLAANPASRDVPHWRTEIQAFMGEIERLSEHVGKKTAAEWATRIGAWRQQLGE
jgi:hypothetical protein